MTIWFKPKMYFNILSVYIFWLTKVKNILIILFSSMVGYPLSMVDKVDKVDTLSNSSWCRDVQQNRRDERTAAQNNEAVRRKSQKAVGRDTQSAFSCSSFSQVSPLDYEKDDGNT